MVANEQVVDLQEVPKPTASRAALFSKIAAVMGELERIPKTGFNAHFKYHYSTDGDVNDAVRRAMANHNLALLVDMRNVKQEVFGKSVKFTVEFEFTLACGDTGATWSNTWIGEALDGQDKGINKAATSAEKYFLMKTFVISTGDAKDDPDSQSHNSHWAEDVEKQKLVVQALKKNDVTKEEVTLRLERGKKLTDFVETSLDLTATLERIVEIGMAKKAAANGSETAEDAQDAPEQADTPDGAPNGVEVPADGNSDADLSWLTDEKVANIRAMTDLSLVYETDVALRLDLVLLAQAGKIEAKNKETTIEKAISTLMAERDAKAEAQP